MTTKPTRTQMLDAINIKIARTGGGTGPGETGYYLPIQRADVEGYVPEYQKAGVYNTLSTLWVRDGRTLDTQSDNCISYIYNLISNDNK